MQIKITKDIYNYLLPTPCRNNLLRRSYKLANQTYYTEDYYFIGTHEQIQDMNRRIAYLK